MWLDSQNGDIQSSDSSPEQKERSTVHYLCHHSPSHGVFLMTARLDSNTVPDPIRRADMPNQARPISYGCIVGFGVAIRRSDSQSWTRMATVICDMRTYGCGRTRRREWSTRLHGYRLPLQASCVVLIGESFVSKFRIGLDPCSSSIQSRREWWHFTRPKAHHTVPCTRAL